MEGSSIDLPDECWAIIFNLVDPRTDWESLSFVCQQFLNVTNLIRVKLRAFNPSIEVLSRLLQRFPHLKKIFLFNFPGDLDQAIHVIARSELNLHELDLKEPGSNMKNLEMIKVGYCNRVTEVGFSFTLHNTPHLNYLKVEAGSKFESFGVTGSSSYPKNLQSLFFGRIDISDEFLCSITKTCKPRLSFPIRFNCCYADTNMPVSKQSPHKRSGHRKGRLQL